MRFRILALSIGLGLLLAAQPAIAQKHAPISGGLEKNNGRLRLFLTNDAEGEFRGRAVISIGSEVEQREIGQVLVAVAAQTTVFLQFSGAAAAGNDYLLKVFDGRGALILYKAGQIKSVSDNIVAVEVSLSNGVPVAPAAAPAAEAKPAASAPPDVTVRGRLIAGEMETDPLKLAFEISSPNFIQEATLDIALGKHKDQQILDLEGTVVVSFKLPDEVDAEKVSYLLKNKAGKELAKGEIKLEHLMSEDSITVDDIRTDRPSYDFGDQVKLSLFLAGHAAHSYRLEIQARDARGAAFFADQRVSKSGDKAASHEFTFTLPGSGETPIILEFKVFNAETGLLFDSGEREIPINTKTP